jgi:hypothetical protein
MNRGKVKLSVAVDSTSGEEAPDFDGSTWLPSFPEAIAEAEVPSGTTASVEVRVSAVKLGTSGERFALGTLGITLWGVTYG